MGKWRLAGGELAAHQRHHGRVGGEAEVKGAAQPERAVFVTAQQHWVPVEQGATEKQIRSS